MSERNNKQNKNNNKNRNNEKNTYQNFNYIIAVLKIVKEQFIKKFTFDENKVVIKYNPINDKEIKQKAEESIETIKNKESFLMCTVGRLAKQKGYDRLVKIAKKLADDGINYELWIIGVGPDDEKLKKYVKDNQLETKVKFLGYQRNPYKYIKKADLFVCSSRAEGYSTVVSEACILGIPTITTNCSGMEEILGKESEYGKIVKNEEEALYKGIYEIITDKELYENYKRKIAQKSAFVQNLLQTVKQIEEILK